MDAIIYPYQKVDETNDFEEDDEEEETEEDSILEVYFKDNQSEQEVENQENLDKKVGLFQKLVGFNSRNKKEA